MNNIDNKYFKLLIRLMKEHKMYQIIKSNKDFHNIPLNTIEDIIKVEVLIGDFCVNGFISVKQYKNFFKDFYKLVNVEKTIIEITNQLINNSSRILNKNKITHLIYLKISLASEIKQIVEECNLSTLLQSNHRLHPFYSTTLKHKLTPDYIDMLINSFIRNIKYTNFN